MTEKEESVIKDSLIEQRHSEEKGDVVEYINSRTGKIQKAEVVSKNGRRAIIVCDPGTGALREMTEYGSDGSVEHFHDHEAIAQALRANPMSPASVGLRYMIEQGQIPSPDWWTDLLVKQDIGDKSH